MTNCDTMNVYIHVQKIDRLSLSVCRSVGRMVGRHRSAMLHHYGHMLLHLCVLDTEIRCHVMYMFVKICGIFVDTFFFFWTATSLLFCIFLHHISVHWTLNGIVGFFSSDYYYFDLFLYFIFGSLMHSAKCSLHSLCNIHNMYEKKFWVAN